MEIICFTDTKYLRDEAEILTSLFSLGLKVLHIRKKHKSTSKLKELISEIPKEYHKRIVIHHGYRVLFKYKLKGIHITRSVEKSWKKRMSVLLLRIIKPNLKISRSIHELNQISQLTKRRYSYVFLSPVFDSISKKGYMASYTEEDLRSNLPLSKCPVVALGGVEPRNVSFANKVGFSGIAALGYLWTTKEVSTIKKFKWLKESVKPTLLSLSIPEEAH